MKKPRSYNRRWDLNCLIFPGTDQVFEEHRPVVVHCRWIAEEQGFFRLSSRLTLNDYLTGSFSNLIFAEGLETNLFLLKNQQVSFTLYFEPLPPNCVRFFLAEDAKGRWPFGAPGLHRVPGDVYNVDLELLPF